MKLNFLEFAEKVIREENRPLTSNEIWEIGKSKNYDQLLNSEGKTPWLSIAARLYVDIRDNPNTKFIKYQINPTKFFLKDLMENNEIVENIPQLVIEDEYKESKSQYKERDLHKYLSYYVYAYKNIHTRTIFHEGSKKNKFAQWLHPDIVGVYFSFEEWTPEILDISKELGSMKIKLYSYELKRELNFNNLRESYFQAVSNSSWAHEGYLVADEIETDEDFTQELKRLNNSFGIGIIKLDPLAPDSSEILFPAFQKEYVDLETMNKIALINPNFKDFLKDIYKDLSIKEIRKDKYDKIYDIEELQNGKGLTK